MNLIQGHEAVGQPETVRIEIADEPGPGGAHYRYRVWVFKNDLWTELCVIPFQKGPSQESIVDHKVVGGVNGLTNETLLAIVAARLSAFQAGSCPCDENALALRGVQGALTALHLRTKDRKARGVEGKVTP